MISFYLSYLDLLMGIMEDYSYRFTLYDSITSILDYSYTTCGI